MIGKDDQKLVGRKQPDRLKPMPVTVTGISCMSTIWLLATFLLLSGLIVAGGFPNWIRNRVETGPQQRGLGNALSRVDLGLFYLCYNLIGCDECDDVCRNQRLCGCYTYLTYDPPPGINTSNLVTTTNMRPTESVRDFMFLFSGSIVYAFGCFLLALSLMVGVIAYCKPRIGSCSGFLFAFVLQALAGISLVVGLALIPVFFGSTFAEQFCGVGAGYYNRGQCSLDWSLFLGMVVTACTLYLPALAIFSMNISDGLNAHVFC